MLKRAVRTMQYVLVFLVFLAGGYIMFRYTRGVPGSSASPQSNNAAMVRELMLAKRVMFVGAHPDDIEFYCGGFVHALCKRGVEVTLVIGTRGGKGRKGSAKRRLEDLRTRHQLDSARILGGAQVVFFDYPDKGLSNHVAEFANDLKNLIGKLKPDVVISWDPDFIYNPHPDHRAAAEAAKLAAVALGSRVCYYGTREPNLWFGFDNDASNIKLRAIRAHRTEVPWLFLPFARRFLTQKDSSEGAKIGSKYAEVYRCVGEWPSKP
ncbi:MAG: PIG-L family deacetylase [Armatimonadetes bacterium]|nr:PIG-L family deacetylase [Armatimonadota bacterium]